MQSTWTVLDAVAAFLLRLSLIGLLSLFLALSVQITELLDRLIMIFLTLFIIYQRRGKFRDYGIPGLAIGRHFLLGIFVGVCLLAISIYTEQLAAEWFSLQVHPGVVALRSANGWMQLIPVFLMAGLISPIAEEFFYRVLIYLPLKKKVGRFLGVLLAAMIFAFTHFSAAWLGELLLVAIALTLLYEQTHSLIAPISAHIALNTGKLLLLLGGYI